MSSDEAHAVRNYVYVRYYTGRKNNFGHNYLEFEVCADGLCRLVYTKNASKLNESLVRREVRLPAEAVEDLRLIIQNSGIMQVEQHLEGDHNDHALGGRLHMAGTRARGPSRTHGTFLAREQVPRYQV